MARITTTDCERVVPNRFELMLLAAARARALGRGARPRVPPQDDKPTVIALRKIAAGEGCSSGGETMTRRTVFPTARRDLLTSSQLRGFASASAAKIPPRSLLARAPR